MASEEVGVIGLGAMGGRLARLLLARGHALAVHDSRQAATAPLAALGARVCSSPQEVAEHAGTVLLSLPTPEIVHEVACGPAGLVHGGTIRMCIDLSTHRPGGGPRDRARARPGWYRAGGRPRQWRRRRRRERDADRDGRLQRGRPGARQAAAEELAARIFHVGDQPGLGQLAKVLNNLLSATALAATAEAVALGVGSGLMRRRADVFNASSGRNSATAQKFPTAVLTRTFDFGFALALMNKDVDICVAQARDAGFAMPWARPLPASGRRRDRTFTMTPTALRSSGSWRAGRV